MAKKNTTEVPYTITLEERDRPNHKVTAALHDKPPVPREGGGGWEPVQLPKRAAVLIWRGRGLMQMQVPVIFDTGNDEHPLAGADDTLIHMWRPEVPEGEQAPEPPVIEISSPGDAVPFTDLEWVVEDIEWGEAVADAKGRKTQQAYVIVLREFREDERLQTADQAKGKKTKARYYKVRRKDLAGGLVGIAHKLHLKGGWKELGNAQHPPIRDPRYRLKVGQHLVIPHTTTSRRQPPSRSNVLASGGVRAR